MTYADCSLFAAAASAAAAGGGETGWLSVSEADVTWFIHIISSTHLGRARQSVRLNNVCGAKGPGGRWAVISDAARNKSAAEFHLHFKHTAPQRAPPMYSSLSVSRGPINDCIYIIHFSHQRIHILYHAKPPMCQQRARSFSQLASVKINQSIYLANCATT